MQNRPKGTRADRNAAYALLKAKAEAGLSIAEIKHQMALDARDHEGIYAEVYEVTL